MVGKQGVAVCQNESNLSQVANQVSILDMSIGELEGMLKKIESRIDKILVPTGPETAPDNAMAPIIVPLAQELSELVRRINALHGRMNSMLARIEL